MLHGTEAAPHPFITLADIAQARRDLWQWARSQVPRAFVQSVWMSALAVAAVLLLMHWWLTPAERAPLSALKIAGSVALFFACPWPWVLIFAHVQLQRQTLTQWEQRIQAGERIPMPPAPLHLYRPPPPTNQY